MSNSPDTTTLDTCGCCPDASETPEHHNPPGQKELVYRIGTYASLLARMQARLHQAEILDGDHAGDRPLAALTTRAPDDFAIGLLDAWAVVGDVLTFYQERLANEGFLRTATERRSVREMARAIGYELRPGVAASVYLAFTVDEGKGSPGEAVVQAGTQLQSLPTSQDELPQTFETSADLTAYATWNALRPQQRRTQTLTLDADDLYLDGIGLNLAAGDLLLLVETDDTGTVIGTAPRPIRSVDPDAANGHTYVALEAADNVVVAAAITSQADSVATQAIDADPKVFAETQLGDMLSLTLSEATMQAYLNVRGWQIADVLDYVDSLTIDAPAGIQVFVLRERLGIFGHNAPLYASLPIPDKASNPAGYAHDWDDPASPWPITKDTVTNDLYDDATVYLERPVKGITQESWVVFEQPGTPSFACLVSEAFEASVAGFGMSAKCMALDMTDPADPEQVRCETDEGSLDDFFVRKTTAYVKSEALTLTGVPVTDDLVAGATELVLDGMVLGLQEGQPVALTGEQADAPGVIRSEIRFIADVVHSEGASTLVFSEGLTYSYLRSTLTLNANVAHATHGETVGAEALGSGDGTQAHQQFALKKPPLTYVSASTPSGTESTLTVRVDGVAWDEAETLYGAAASDRAFIVRHDDDANAFVTFGDGKQGARLPTGMENVVATYRSGIGADGDVDAGTITLLKKKPFGVRSVLNPLAASGADDPEATEDARTNAPLTVLTLDRIVSLQDYEDFARAFAGVGKAKAVVLWTGEEQIVHITIADASGNEVTTSSDLFVNLSVAIEASRDPLQRAEVGSFERLYFNLSAKVWIDAAYVWDDVKADLTARLQDAFGFAARVFGRPVAAANVLSVMHDAEGVVAVDLDELYQITDTGDPAGDLWMPVLPAQPARYDTATRTVLPAELLLINDFGITLTEAK